MVATVHMMMTVIMGKMETNMMAFSHRKFFHGRIGWAMWTALDLAPSSVVHSFNRLRHNSRDKISTRKS